MLDGFGQNELMDEPLFLKVRPGDAVLYKKAHIGKVLTFIGGSRDPQEPTLFQIEKLIQIKSHGFMERNILK